MHRRSFLLGLASLLAAPVIVQASSLMPVKQMILTPQRFRRYSAVLDSIHKVVHYYDADGNIQVEWTQIESVIGDPKPNLDYVISVQQEIEKRGCTVDQVPLTILPAGVHEPLTTLAKYDQQFVTNFGSDPEPINGPRDFRNRPSASIIDWDLALLGG